MAAITIASSGDVQTKPWHSNCLGMLGDFMTTANNGECKPDDSLLLSAALFLSEKYTLNLCANNENNEYISHLNGRNKVLLSIFSGSVMSGKNAAPPSDCETTNLTADHTAIL